MRYRILVVLSEPLGASYREALEGLRAEWPGTLATSTGRPLPPGPHGVIIALGGRAAIRASQAGAPLVAALAPSFRAASGASPTVQVAMTPSPERFVSLLAAAGVHRLLAVRAAPADPDFVRRAAQAGKRRGVTIEDALMTGPDALPRLLRAVGTSADAVWLAPDPDAATRESFAVAREFARDRGIPLFAPAAGLVTAEIRGDLAVSFRDCGRAAASAARTVLAGGSTQKVFYPEPAR